MLVLTRRLGEELIIGGVCRVTLVGIKGKTVRLGVTAPPQVSVLRSELLARSGDPKRSLCLSARNKITSEVS